MRLAARIIRALKEGGPRKVHVFRGRASDQADYERAIGQLFLEGSVEWRGAKSGRLLAAKTGKGA